MQKKFNRLVNLVEKQYKAVLPQTGKIPFALTMDGQEHTFGTERPAFTITINDEQAVAALSTLDQNTIAEAYLNGSIDLNGDIMKVLALRELFNDKRSSFSVAFYSAVTFRTGKE
jgi:cyclopropane-fatty-acyl-phospholipid synthase